MWELFILLFNLNKSAAQTHLLYMVREVVSGFIRSKVYAEVEFKAILKNDVCPAQEKVALILTSNFRMIQNQGICAQCISEKVVCIIYYMLLKSRTPH